MNRIQNTNCVSPQKTDPLSVLIGGVAFLYIVSVYVINSIPGLSRLCITLALLLGLLVVTQTLISQKRFPMVFLLPWLFFTYCMFSSGWATEYDIATAAYIQIFSTVLGGTMIWQARNLGLSWKWIVWAMVLGSILLIASSRGEVAMGGAEGRAAGLSGNANIMALALAYCAYVIWFSPCKLPKWMFPLGIVFMLYGVAFTGSRKSLLFVVVAAAYCIFWLILRIRKASTWAILFLGLVGSIFCFDYIQSRNVDVMDKLSSFSSINRLTKMFTGKEESAESRSDMASEAINLWAASPIIGHGAGQFRVVSSFTGLYSHCNYTEILADYGLIGFILYYSLHFIMIVRSSVQVLSKHNWQYISPLVFFFLILIIDFFMVSHSDKLSLIILGLSASLVTANDQNPVPVRVNIQSTRMLSISKRA